MKRLTAKEEEVMGFFWEKGPLFVKQLLEFYRCWSSIPSLVRTSIRFPPLCGGWKRKAIWRIRHSAIRTNTMPLCRKTSSSAGR